MANFWIYLTNFCYFLCFISLEINKNSGEAENVAIKDSKFEQWCQRLQDPRVIDPARVQIFKICQNLTSAEAVDLYNILKNDIEQSSSLAKDATPM